MTVDNSQRLCRFYHETYSICSLLDISADVDWLYRGRMHRATNGALMLMEPGEVHVTKRAPGVAKRYAVLMILPEAMRLLTADPGGSHGSPHLAHGSVDDASIFRGFARLHESLRAQTTALEQQSRLAESVRCLIERCGEAPPIVRSERHHPGVARARDYIHDHYRDDVGLHELADAACVSSYHLCRLFSMRWDSPRTHIKCRCAYSPRSGDVDSFVGCRRPPSRRARVSSTRATSGGVSRRLLASHRASMLA